MRIPRRDPTSPRKQTAWCVLAICAPMQRLAIVCLFAPSAALLLAPASVRPAVAPPRAAARMQSLDYNDPMVAKEFGSIQGLDLDDVTDELAAAGIIAPATMNDMEIRMMLVEVRMRKAGTFGGATKPKKQAKPASFANEFERAMFEKPAVKELYTTWQQAKNINAMNLAAEHINNPKRAKDRYAGTPNYDATIAELDAAMNAKVVKTVDTARLMFSGFPSNMGEQGVKMTLQARARRLVPSRERPPAARSTPLWFCRAGIRRDEGVLMRGERRRDEPQRQVRVRGRGRGQVRRRQIRRPGYGPRHHARAGKLLMMTEARGAGGTLV